MSTDTSSILTALKKFPLSWRSEKDDFKLFQPLQALIDYLPRKQRARIVHAFLFAQKAHAGQTRKGGGPYITHPVAVSILIAELKLDADTIIAALLHDVIEDTSCSKERISNEFGHTVSTLVDGVSKLDNIQFNSEDEAQKANFQKMMLAMASDVRVLIIKLADRLHNTLTLDVFSPAKSRRIGQETLDIFAPLASRVGINSWRMLLEERGIHAAQPWRYTIINKAIKRVKDSQKTKIEELSGFISKRLKELGIKAKVYGREKNAYSLYKKMEKQNIRFANIMDLFAYRIIVASTDECYRALGIIHSLYKPVPGKFKDYIALPKSNGYQSLHTVLLGPQNSHIEIQIRSSAMHDIAEYGIAAHWLYKQKTHKEHLPKNSLSLDWLNNILPADEQNVTHAEFMDSIRRDISSPEIYVFTPKNQIFALPSGATPVDLAYAIHTDIGNSCIACEINRQRAPLDQPLRNGETINIVTSTFGSPHPQWLNFSVTSKAQSQIRAYLKLQKESETVVLGKQLLEQMLNKYDAKFDDLPEETIQNVFSELRVSSLKQLLLQIGNGSRPAQLVATQLLNQPQDITPDDSETPLYITGTEGMAVKFGKCCHPIPGDNIMGNLSADRGIVVHRLKCKNIRQYRKTPEKWVTLAWGEADTLSGIALLHITTENRPTTLVDVLHTFHRARMNIESFHTDKGANYSQIQLTTRVEGRKQLAYVMRKLRHLPGVYKVQRS